MSLALIILNKQTTESKSLRGVGSVTTTRRRDSIQFCVIMLEIITSTAPPQAQKRDVSAHCFIVSFDANSLVTVDGMEFDKCEVFGQIFMLHHIRKMIDRSCCGNYEDKKYKERKNSPLSSPTVKFLSPQKMKRE